MPQVHFEAGIELRARGSTMAERALAQYLLNPNDVELVTRVGAGSFGAPNNEPARTIKHSSKSSLPPPLALHTAHAVVID